MLTDCGNGDELSLSATLVAAGIVNDKLYPVYHIIRRIAVSLTGKKPRFLYMLSLICVALRTIAGTLSSFAL